MSSRQAMSGCASPAQIEAAFSRPRDDRDSRRVRDHVIHCPRCRQVLERLADAPDLRRATPRPLTPDAATPAELLARLRDLPQRAPSHPGALAAGLGVLGPAIAPGDQGTLGRYRVLGVLGSGSMGAVLEAFDPRHDRAVVIKILPPSWSTLESRTRFEREARANAQVKHPNIVPVHGIERLPDGTPFLVMPSVGGQTLRQRLGSGPPPTPVEAARWCVQLAEALSAAHAQGLVHRDVKPENVLMGPEEVPLLSDFGLARRFEPGKEDSVTLPGQVVGTPAYMSPEQACGQSVRLDARSDIYSLGVLLYELLTGRVPFQGRDQQVLRQILREEPPPPRRLDARIPRDLETICRKAMAKEPSHRYPTARAMADDLHRFLDRRPIQARRPGLPSRLRGWVRRRAR